MNKLKVIKIILFTIMLGLIYVISPKIAYLIQNGAKYIYELDTNYISGIVELILAVLFSIIVMLKINNQKSDKK